MAVRQPFGRGAELRLCGLVGPGIVRSTLWERPWKGEQKSKNGYRVVVTAALPRGAGEGNDLQGIALIMHGNANIAWCVS